MKEKGMGRTRLGRFAAVTVPATAVSLGLGFAIVQGAVSAQLSAANAFDVGSSQATGTGLELSLAPATAAATDTDSTTTAQNESALVTLAGGQLDGMCLAANTNVPLFGNIGLTISVPTVAEGGALVDVGTLDLNAESVNTGATTLPATSVGIAESELDHQSTLGSETPGGFGMESVGNVSLAELDAAAYGLELTNGLSLQSLSIAPTTTTAAC